jgi:hypothetical protein
LLGGNFVLSRRGLQLLQAEFHLLDQPCRAFRALAIKLVPQIGDLQLLMGNERPVGGGPGAACRYLGACPGNA